MASRAAQFSPFAALTGYDDMIEETARYTDDFREIDEDGKAVLQQKMNVLLLPENAGVPCEFTYFVPDGRKQGGSMAKTVSWVRKIDTAGHAVVLGNGVSIPVSYLTDIDGEIFGRYAGGE